MKPFVVYTAISRGYDVPKPVHAAWQEEADFVMFTETPAPAGWAGRPLREEFADPCRNAKVPKILPHRFFPDHEYSIWIDGSVLITSHVRLSALLSELLSEHDMAVFRHRTRQCIYQEAQACIRQGNDDPEVIMAQVAKYWDSGYPENNGLAECPILIRRHSPAVIEFCEAWHKEIVRHSRRDQLSFNYVVSRCGLKYREIPGSVLENPHFGVALHARFRPRG